MSGDILFVTLERASYSAQDSLRDKEPSSAKCQLYQG